MVDVTVPAYLNAQHPPPVFHRASDYHLSRDPSREATERKFGIDGRGQDPPPGGVHVLEKALACGAALQIEESAMLYASLDVLQISLSFVLIAGGERTESEGLGNQA